jgi:hypothetical protein
MQACNQAESRALARPVGADQTENFALAKFERNRIDGSESAKTLR